MRQPPSKNDRGALSAPVLRQEARRVLRRLAEPESYITPLGADRAGVFVKRNAFQRPVISLAEGDLRAFLAAGLLDPAPDDRYVLSEAGAAFLLRVASGDDGFLAQHRLMGQRAVADGPASAAKAKPAVLRAVNRAETPLGWLVRRKDANGAPLITAEHYAAGERLREDYTRGQLMPRVTMDWSRPIASDGSGGGESLSEAAFAARRRVNAAIEAVGPGLSDVLIEVCCHLRGLEETERTLRWPPRAGKIVIRIALERLARFYGQTARPAGSPGRSRTWSAPDA